MARPRVGRAQPPDRAGHAARDPGGGGVVRRLRLRAGPDRPDDGRAGRDPRPGRASTSATATSFQFGRVPSAWPARSRPTATTSPGWSSRRDRARAIVGVYGIAQPADPGAHRVRLRGLDPEASTVSRRGRSDGRSARRAPPPARGPAPSSWPPAWSSTASRHDAARLGRLLGAPVRPRASRHDRPAEPEREEDAPLSPWSSPGSGRGRTASGARSRR